MTIPSASPASDELLAKARRGDESAREGIAREYRQAVYLFSLHLVGNPEDAKDLTQDTMLRFFSTLGRFQTGRPVRPWLFAIARNRARDLWRRAKIRRHEPLDEEIPDLSTALSDSGTNPEADTLQRERRRLLWKAISRLDGAKREILVLRDFHDFSYAEIAQVLDIPAGTVMSRLHAARQALRHQLDQGFFTGRPRRHR
jgi:RNA polymerase sigma-70 factor (ECF subfamily)